MAPSCWFFWAWWLPLMLAVVAAEEQAEGCSAKKSCGNITISDPFWLTDLETGRSCGGPLDFEVHCYNNTPILRSSGIYGFAILDIAYEERSLRVVDTGKLKFLNDSGSCQAPTWNTSDELSSPFRIGPANLESCTTAQRQRWRRLVETRMRCGNKSKVLVRVAGSYTETSGYAIEGCDAIVVPVLGGAAKGVANASDYEQQIRDGILLTLESPFSSIRCM